MENITRTLAEFAREASLRTRQGNLEFPGRIRIFCQKRRIDEANAAKPLEPSQAEPGKELRQMISDSTLKGIPGWGYFMIARVEVLPLDSSAIPHGCMDLYLFKERE